MKLKPIKQKMITIKLEKYLMLKRMIIEQGDAMCLKIMNKYS